MRPYLELIRTDLVLALRDKAVLFFTYLFPLLFFFAAAELLDASQITYGVSMVVMLGVLGNGLFGAGMRTVADREQNILRRFRVAPISPTPLLVASIVTGWVIYLPAVLAILALAMSFYGMDFPAHPLDLILILTVGIFAFRSLGLILASVANSMQEINILVQLVYTPMLFLSGVLFPITWLPDWVQIISQYLPATYLVNAFQGSLLRGETLADNALSIAALVLTVALSLFISTRIFRWEKGEAVAFSSKMWVAAVLAPFLLLGTWEAFNRDQIRRARILERELARAESFLVRGARIFVGDGAVLESASVLVRRGRIERIYSDGAPSAADLGVELVEAAGKTLLPGLIDAHVHLSAPGGLLPQDEALPAPADAMERALAAYLYSGVTAVRTVGDPLDVALALRERIASGELLGAELVVAAPMFTTEGGHGTEFFAALPERNRTAAEQQWLRLPATAGEARQQVTELAAAGIDGIKVVLESGTSERLFERLDATVFAAIAQESRRLGLPMTVHTGDRRDVEDALDAGAAGVEHGSYRETLPAALLERAAAGGLRFVPTLSVVDAFVATAERSDHLLRRPLLLQVVPEAVLEATRERVDEWPGLDPEQARRRLETGRSNLVAAAAAGVELVTGTDSGNFLLPHGPGIHREMQLWVEAGLEPAAALMAATSSAARLLGAPGRIGMIREGLEATFLLVDGNPLVDISDSERISMVVFKGERVSRAALFDQ